MKVLKDVSCATCGAKESKESEPTNDNQDDDSITKSQQSDPPKAKVTLMCCAKCQVVFYCSKECQRKHWKEHKSHCKIGLPGWKASKKDIREGEKIQNSYLKQLFLTNIEMKENPQARRKISRSNRIEDTIVRCAKIHRLESSHGTIREDPEANKAYEEALSLIDKGELLKAVYKLNKAIHIDKHHHLYLNARSYCYRLLEQYDFASMDAHRAQNLEPDYIPAWSNMIKAKFCLGEHKKARKNMKLCREIFITDTCGRDFTNDEHFHLVEETAAQLERDLANVQAYPFRAMFIACGKMSYMVTKGLHLRKQQDLLFMDVRMSIAKKINKFVENLYYNQIEPGTMFQLGDFVEEEGERKEGQERRVALYFPIKNNQHIKIIKKEYDTVRRGKNLHPGKFFAAVIVFTSRQEMETTFKRKSIEETVKKTDGSLSHYHIPLTKEEGDAYVKSIIDNRNEWRKRYWKGEGITSIPNIDLDNKSERSKDNDNARTMRGDSDSSAVDGMGERTD